MATELLLQNPQASVPLRINLDVTCNTPQDRILANVFENSKRKLPWIKQEEAHDRIAVLCGSGPSLGDCIEEIRTRKAQGAHVFALNGAAKFLDGQQILADFQIIMDAQPRTIDVVGPAMVHLLASQVDPVLFDAVSDPVLWHATYGDIKVDEQPDFPKHNKDYCLVGGLWSVGNTSLPLLYAMGYRNIQIYGMDSSHRDGVSHAAHQSINDDDIYTLVDRGGKKYTTSLTMKMQAEGFTRCAGALMRGGCKIEVHGSGLLPDMWNNSPQGEQEKYHRLWEMPEYRKFSPGEHAAQKFIELIKPDGLIIDYGCGTGRGAMALADAGLRVLLVDFADNCRDPEALDLPFKKYDLTEPMQEHSRFGFCTDVMEHIPTDDVETVIKNIMASSQTVFFQISTVPDNMGSLINSELHLTVKPHAWWLEMFQKLGFRIRYHQPEETNSIFVIVNQGAENGKA